MSRMKPLAIGVVAVLLPVLITLGQPPTSAPAFNRAELQRLLLERAAKEIDQVQDLTALSMLGSVSAKGGEKEAALKIFAMVESELASPKQGRDRAAEYASLAIRYAKAGDLTGNRRCIESALKVLRADRSPPGETEFALSRIAIAQALAGDARWRSNVKAFLPVFTATNYFEVAGELAGVGRMDECREAMKLGEQTIAELSKSPNPVGGRASSLYHYEVITLVAFDFGAATAVADKIEEGSDKVAAYLTVAEHCFDHAQREKAAGFLEKAAAVRIDAQDESATEHLLAIITRAKQLDRTQVADKTLARLRALAEAARVPETRACAFLDLAAAQTALGNKAGAAESMRMAEAVKARMKGPIEFDPTSSPYARLAMQQAEQGDVDSALATLKRVHDEDSRESASIELAEEFAALGKLDSAQSLIKGVGPRSRWLIIGSIARGRVKSGRIGDLETWIASLPDPASRLHAGVSAISQLQNEMQ